MTLLSDLQLELERPHASGPQARVNIRPAIPPLGPDVALERPRLAVPLNAAGTLKTRVTMRIHMFFERGWIWRLVAAYEAHIARGVDTTRPALRLGYMGTMSYARANEETTCLQVW